ncbi:MAG TPA: glycogen synthase GlgA [Polyangiaceae bacterium]|nr:glycogen synthase GlgA [Polyangiaceae bacterium]
MPAPLSVLFVASECAQFVKSGGLGDVVAALPIALRALGVDARIVLPRYDAISLQGLVRHDAPLGVPLGRGEAWAGVLETRMPGSDVPVYLLDHRELFGRGYLYDPPGGSAGDNLVRYGFLCRGALQLCLHLGFTPDVFHVHDWPSALLPIQLNTTVAHTPLARAASVLTIHNLAHQAKFPARDLPSVHIPWSELRADSLEDFGGVNPLKGGLFHATKLTTVSPRYAQEIRTREGGAGLDAVIRFRGADVVGILNGIDEKAWNPARDAAIAAPFDVDDFSGKAACKRALQRELGLAERPDVPLIGVVSRLSSQKGIDVIVAALTRILDLDTQVVILGSGDPSSEGYLNMHSQHGGSRFRAWIGFNEDVAHRIEAGADLFLMPSRFEPCGLNQMYSQRYGTLPIVRATGGLDDTVENYDPATGDGTGFKLWDLNADSLFATVRWAVETYRERPGHFRQMQRRAMRKRFGWDVAAAEYAKVYEWAVEDRTGVRGRAEESGPRSAGTPGPRGAAETGPRSAAETGPRSAVESKGPPRRQDAKT